MHTKLKHIAVSERNSFTLRSLGSAVESFNDVATEVLKNVKIGQNTVKIGGVDLHYKKVNR